MKVLVTGVVGQLGHDMVNELIKRGHETIGSDIMPVYSGIQNGSAGSFLQYVPLDITNQKAVQQTIGHLRPDVVVHCAAWTAVDAAEDEENSGKVLAINAEGTKYIAQVCALLGSKLMYISTDYVFDGRGEKPWKPDCCDYAPLNRYGQTKLEGEIAVADLTQRYFIVRTSWVFGLNGNNFINTMLRLGKTHKEICVVDDQIGTPTYTMDLARLLADILETEKYGYYHATNEGGYISWADFAREIFRQAGIPVRVIPVATKEYGLSKAARPLNSRLDKGKLIKKGFEPLPDWRDALKRYLREIGKILG